MKILAIGDPHGDVKKIKKIRERGIDFILLTGDIGKADLARKRAFENVRRKKEGLPEIEDTAESELAIYEEIHSSTLDVLRYLSNLAPVYTIQGNVSIPSKTTISKKEAKYGIPFPNTLDEIKKLRNVYLVKNGLRRLNGFRVGFLEYFVDTCWVREFKPGDYKKKMRSAKKDTEKASRVLDRFGGGLDILVCHQPPYGYLDKVTAKFAPKHWQGLNAGSKAILGYVKKNNPSYVLCGHIHEGEGSVTIGKSKVYNLGVAEHMVIEIE